MFFACMPLEYPPQTNYDFDSFYQVKISMKVQHSLKVNHLQQRLRVTTHLPAQLNYPRYIRNRIPPSYQKILFIFRTFFHVFLVRWNLIKCPSPNALISLRPPFMDLSFNSYTMRSTRVNKIELLSNISITMTNILLCNFIQKY